MSKYKSKKITIDGMTFDSKKEAQRYIELRKMQNTGKITDLKCQVKYLLIPSQKVANKVVERAVTYIADFEYIKDGQKIVEDVKGYRKGQAYALFVIKRKLMLYVHNIRVIEI